MGTETYAKSSPLGARKNVAPGDNNEHMLPSRYSRFNDAGSIGASIARASNDYKKGAGERIDHELAEMRAGLDED